jgi:hypothetical protein
MLFQRWRPGSAWRVEAAVTVQHGGIFAGIGGRVRVDTLVFLNRFFNLWVAVVDNFIGRESVF